MDNFDVSVVVLTYNFDYAKLFCTLKSVISQKGLKFEVIVSDDASDDFNEEKIKEWFHNNNFSDYKIVTRCKNQGTVGNLNDALFLCRAKYVKLISPGDLLYDVNTLKKLLDFSENNQCGICFGDCIYYSVDNNAVQIYPKLHYPKRLGIYKKNKSSRLIFNFLVLQDVILAPAYFISKDILIKYISIIHGKIKYREDVIYFLMVADGIKFFYVNTPVVWYEYGTGVSTSKSEKWRKLLEQDFNNCYEKLYNSYIKDNIISAFYHTSKMNKKLSKTIYMVLNHPMILFTILKIRLMPKSIGLQHPINKKILENYLKMGSEY